MYYKPTVAGDASMRQGTGLSYRIGAEQATSQHLSQF